MFTIEFLKSQYYYHVGQVKPINDLIINKEFYKNHTQNKYKCIYKGQKGSKSEKSGHSL